MSLALSGGPAVQDVVVPSKGSLRCRIPQRMSSARQKPQQQNRVKPPPEVVKPKFEAILHQQRCPPRNTAPRPRSNESQPKSVNRVKDDLGIGRSVHTVTRPRFERNPNPVKKPSTIPRKIVDNGNKMVKPIIVPVTHPSQKTRDQYKYTNKQLPDQETISQIEKSEEMNDLDFTNMSAKASSLSSQNSKIVELKTNWQQNMTQLEKMKSDLNDRQKAIVELYALMKNTHTKMTRLGQKEILPPSEDLRIMNVAKLSAEQLLQLCSVRPDGNGKKDSPMSHKPPQDLDMNKLYSMPSKLVATCEQTLFKRKEIIDWFETLKTVDKGISMDKLSCKINEFNAENEMLRCSLKQAKGEFIKELNDIIEFMRKTVNETVALQLRTEELTYTLSDLNSQNADLRKQLHNSDHLRSHTNKAKVEELEKELKEEKCKKIFIRDRLARAEGQIKIGAERASQLEAALEQANSHTWTLERNVQQLNYQNEALQSEFDLELNKLRESIRENTLHLEEIADAREKLQAEKDNLEQRLGDLSKYYKESLESVKHDMNVNVAKLIEAEKKCENEVEEKKGLEVKLESLNAKLLESELRVKDLTKELGETKEKLGLAMTFEAELSATKRELDIAVIEIEDYKKKMAEQSETLKEYENSIKESISLEEHLKADLSNKDKLISDLETKQAMLIKRLQESESKMGSYQEQLTCLKSNITELQEDFGEFENLNELHEMVNEQRSKLLEATKQNGELAEALQKKDVEMERHMDVIAEQELLLEQRNSLVKMLNGKDEEHTNIIKLLRNNLELRTQADMDLNQQITDKNAEIETLITNVETRKQQISQMEKIILTLEDQMRKASMQRRKDQDKINLLETKMGQYEAYHMYMSHNDTPSKNLDSLLKIIENELGSTATGQNLKKEQDYVTAKEKYIPDRGRDRLENYECHKGNNNQSIYQSDHERPSKIVTSNFGKKTYMTNDDQFQSENLDRKKAITKMDTQKLLTAADLNSSMYGNNATIKDNNYPPFRGLLPAGSHLKDNLLSRNIQLLTSNQLRDEKKSKMFKIAGHRL